MRASWLLSIALGSMACLPSAKPVEVVYDSGDLLIFATATNEDAPEVLDVSSYVPASVGDARIFATRKNEPFYVFRIKAGDLAGATGPLTREQLAEAIVRRADADYEPSCASLCTPDFDTCVEACTGAACRESCASTRDTCLSNCGSTRTGDCGRCLAPTSFAPQVVNDGDSCRIPIFARGELFMPVEGGWIPQVDVQSQRAIETARLAMRIDFPRACACSGTIESPPLDRLDIIPISPLASPWPLPSLAQNQSGIVAGMNDRVAITFDPSTTPVTQKITNLEDYPAEVRVTAALRDGSFLAGAEQFNETLAEGYRFDKFPLLADGSLGQPIPVTPAGAPNPRIIKYLSEIGDFPLWLIGSATADFNVHEGALFACRDDPLQCARANVDPCPGDQGGLIIDDALILPDGSGIGVADRALYFKEPSMNPAEPRPEDLWKCTTYSEAFPWRSGAPGAGDPIPVKPFRTIGNIGDRVFLCGKREPPRCTSSYPVVLSATVAAAPGMTPALRFEIIAAKSRDVDCQKFLPVPGNPDQIRLMFRDGTTMDFDANGNIVAEDQIGELFGPNSLGWLEIRPLQTGNLLARTRENGVYLSDGVAPFKQLYGTEPAENASYGRVVSAGDEFFVFGRSNSITRVEVRRDPPGALASLITDPEGALKTTDRVRDAIVDHAATAETPGSVVLLLAGYVDVRPIEPMLRRVRIDPPGVIGAFEDLVLPESIAGLAIDGVAETGPGRFAAIVQDTRLLDITGSEAIEVPLLPETFDDPTTEMVETKPQLPPYDCNGGPQRLDAFRDIDGKNGVAWAVGQYGIIMRIVAGRAERFVPTVEETAGTPMPVTADLSTVRVACPDSVLIAGRYDRAMGEGGRSLHVWKIVSETSPDECFPGTPKREPIAGAERLVVREVRDDAGARCLNLPSAPEVTYAWPRSLLLDGDVSAVVLDNGFLQRFDPTSVPRPGSGGRIKVPFSVQAVGQNARGELLFGGSESRMAVGIPGRAR